MYSVNHLNFSNVEMTLIALIEQKAELKLRCGVGTLNEVQNIFFNSPSIKKRKVSIMLCRHFYHVPPWAVFSSAPAGHPAGALGSYRAFSARCEDPHQPPASVMPYQALLAVAGSPDLPNLPWGVRCPPVCLRPLAFNEGVVYCAGQVCGQSFFVAWLWGVPGETFIVPFSGGLLAAYVSGKASRWAGAVDAGEVCGMCFGLYGKVCWFWLGYS